MAFLLTCARLVRHFEFQQLLSAAFIGNSRIFSASYGRTCLKLPAMAKIWLQVDPMFGSRPLNFGRRLFGLDC